MNEYKGAARPTLPDVEPASAVVPAAGSEGRKKDPDLTLESGEMVSSATVPASLSRDEGESSFETSQMRTLESALTFEQP